MVKLNFFKYFLIVFVTTAFILAGCVSVYAKSENSGSGNSKSGSNNSKSGSSNSSNSSSGNQGSDKTNNKDSGDTNNQGSSSNFGKGSFNSGSGSINSGKKNKESEVKRGKGKILLEDAEEEDATESGKVKKLNKVLVKEASQSAQGKRRAIQGVISAIDGSVLTIAHQIHRDRIFKVIYNSLTIIKSKEASGSASLQIGLRVVAVGDLDSSGMLVAKRIHIIPGKAVGIFRRFPIASSSASPTATSSAQPSAEPSATP